LKKNDEEFLKKSRQGKQTGMWQTMHRQFTDAVGETYKLLWI